MSILRIFYDTLNVTFLDDKGIFRGMHGTFAEEQVIYSQTDAGFNSYLFEYFIIETKYILKGDGVVYFVKNEKKWNNHKPEGLPDKVNESVYDQGVIVYLSKQLIKINWSYNRVSFVDTSLNKILNNYEDYQMIRCSLDAFNPLEKNDYCFVKNWFRLMINQLEGKDILFNIDLHYAIDFYHLPIDERIQRQIKNENIFYIDSNNHIKIKVILSPYNTMVLYMENGEAVYDSYVYIEFSKEKTVADILFFSTIHQEQILFPYIVKSYHLLEPTLKLSKR